MMAVSGVWRGVKHRDVSPRRPDEPKALATDDWNVRRLPVLSNSYSLSPGGEGWGEGEEPADSEIFREWEKAFPLTPGPSPPGERGENPRKTLKVLLRFRLVKVFVPTGRTHHSPGR